MAWDMTQEVEKPKFGKILFLTLLFCHQVEDVFLPNRILFNVIWDSQNDAELSREYPTYATPHIADYNRDILYPRYVFGIIKQLTDIYCATVKGLTFKKLIKFLETAHDKNGYL